jgi:hypothetical protein
MVAVVDMGKGGKRETVPWSVGQGSLQQYRVHARVGMAAPPVISA